MAKKCTEKRDARAKWLFCQSKLNAFSPFSLLSPLLKSCTLLRELNSTSAKNINHAHYLENSTARQLKIYRTCAVINLNLNLIDNRVNLSCGIYDTGVQEYDKRSKS